jgi:hypothetical protein
VSISRRAHGPERGAMPRTCVVLASSEQAVLLRCALTAGLHFHLAWDKSGRQHPSPCTRQHTGSAAVSPPASSQLCTGT